MNKEQGILIPILLIIVTALLIFGLWYIRSPHFKFGQHIDFTDEEVTEKIEAGEEHFIDMTNKGFVPERVTISPYDTLTFRNKDRGHHQPIAEGGNCETFGSPRALLMGETYSYIFTEQGECSYKDNRSDAPSGQITIE